MTLRLRLLHLASVAAILSGCVNAARDEESLGIAQEALNACDETVPTTRAVDGFPAYAQCAAIQQGAIWSNNGIDTAATSQGADWVRTQYSGGYQCTEFARRYFLFRWGIDYQHGNAGDWCDGTLPSTLTLATSPTHGDLIVFAPSCGADSTTGHIAVVDTVDMAGAKVTIVEQNQASRRSTQQSCAKCYLHAVKNDGTSGGGSSGGGSSGGTGVGGSSGSSSSGGGSSGGGGGTASSAGSSSGGSTAGAATSSNGGSSSGGATAGVAGSIGTSGGAPAGGSASSSGAGSSAGPPVASNEATSADDASCSVGKVGGASPGSWKGLLLAGLAVFFRSRTRRRVG